MTGIPTNRSLVLARLVTMGEPLVRFPVFNTVVAMDPPVMLLLAEPTLLETRRPEFAKTKA